MNIDPTVTTGNLLTIGSMIASVLLLAYVLGGKFAAIDAEFKLINQRMATLADTLNKLGEVLTTQAVQSQRIDFLEGIVSKLQTGEGFQFNIMESLVARHRVEPNRPGSPR